MFTAQDYESKVINPRTGRPCSKPKKEWGWDVYYVWRILRFDLGIDPKLPVMAETMGDLSKKLCQLNQRAAPHSAGQTSGAENTGWPSPALSLSSTSFSSNPCRPDRHLL